MWQKMLQVGSGEGGYSLVDKIIGIVPTMTSNTTPKGKADCDIQFHSSNPAWRAFDGNSSTWWTANSTSGSTLWYEFEKPINIGRVEIGQQYSIRASVIKIIARNTSSESWTTICTCSNTNEELFTKGINFSDFYKMWGIQIITSSDRACITKLQFYGITEE